MLLALFVGVLSIAPLARLVSAALLPQGSFDAARIGDLLGGRRVVEATLNTLWIATASTLLAIVIGTLAALLAGCATVDPAGERDSIFEAAAERAVSAAQTLAAAAQKLNRGEQ